MSYLTIAGKIFKGITSPLGILEDWANEPLKRWENEREQKNRDREVEREITKKTGVKKVESELRRQEAEHETRLKIRMQTEIERINAETEQWAKDQEFQRMKDLAEAVTHYRQCLADLQLNIIRAIGEMNIGLRKSAQDLILTKTREYKALQDQAQKDAEAEFERINDKFSGNERIMNIMISSSEKKLVSIIDSTTEFLRGLNEDIQNMNRNIDEITREGQKTIDTTTRTTFNGLPPTNGDVKQIQ